MLIFCSEITKYLNRKDVQALLGVDPQVSQYDVCSSTVEHDFTLTLDVVKGATDYVAALLERGVRVLVYVGTYDFGCNWIGNEAWTLALEWSGHTEFVAQSLRKWTVGSARVGRMRSAKGLMFATVDAAGHMVRTIYLMDDFHLRSHVCRRHTTNPRSRWRW